MVTWEWHSLTWWHSICWQVLSCKFCPNYYGSLKPWIVGPQEKRFPLKPLLGLKWKALHFHRLHSLIYSFTADIMNAVNGPDKSNVNVEVGEEVRTSIVLLIRLFLIALRRHPSSGTELSVQSWKPKHGHLNCLIDWKLELGTFNRVISLILYQTTLPPIIFK